VSSGPDETTPAWFESDPDRLEWELACFREAGLKAEYSVLESGLLAIATEVTFEGEPVAVRTVFSADHPSVPPHVFGPPGFLERHQDPEGGNFCVVDNEQNWWRPNYPAVWLVQKLQELLEATATGENAVAAGEADMPEPLSGHIAKREKAAVLVPEACLRTRRRRHPRPTPTRRTRSAPPRGHHSRGRRREAPWRALAGSAGARRHWARVRGPLGRARRGDGVARDRADGDRARALEDRQTREHRGRSRVGALAGGSGRDRRSSSALLSSRKARRGRISAAPGSSSRSSGTATAASRVRASRSAPRR
jgi:hypothetical protein